MTLRPAAKGWCPGAYRPMESGDGLIVRVRPQLARLTAEQALGLCAAALAHGSGLIDLTSRANLQLRGVTEDRHQALIDDLWALGLLDADPALEGRRNILVDPSWQDGDETQRIAAALVARLAELPPLPAKFGFAIDAGPAPVLVAASADIRVERGVSGGLILRADGSALGCAISAPDAVDAILALARWFAETGGAQAGRMARHVTVHAFHDGGQLGRVQQAFDGAVHHHVGAGERGHHRAQLRDGVAGSGGAHRRGCGQGRRGQRQLKHLGAHGLQRKAGQVHVDPA
jgi:precorrin-3B synthase